MLPDLNIDRDDYDSVLEEAKNLIISMYPEWTDFNEHDPGITMLELFAVMKESQQFFANQIGERNRQAYLKLLGVQRRTKRPAHSYVKINAQENCRIVKSHKTDALGLCFETIGAKQLIRNDLQLCIAVCGGQTKDMLDREQLLFGDPLYFKPFGEHPKDGDCFYIGFAQPLPDNVVLDLYAEIYKAYEVKRNPLKDGCFKDLAKIRWQYHTADGWMDAEHVCDETHGFLFDGFVRFVVGGEMEQVCIMGRTKYFIRGVLKKSVYDLPPILTDISMNVCEVIQTDTYVEHIYLKKPQSDIALDTELSILGTSEIFIETDGCCYPADYFIKEINWERGIAEFLIDDPKLQNADGVMVINRENTSLYKRRIGFGNGFPNQEIDLEDLQVEYDSFALMIADSSQNGGYRIWDKVCDFSNSLPHDRHYMLDTRRGTVLFGNCIHGMAPDGEIILAGYARTAGRDGNVKVGAINQFRTQRSGTCEIFNIREGYGGQDEETLQESFYRAKKRIRESGCAVTKQDYERYVRQTPGLMIESCKVICIDDIKKFSKKTDETAIHIVVKPFGNNNMAEERYSANIRNYLEPYRTLGSQIHLFFPEYVAVSVYVEAVVKPQYPDIEKRLRQAVSHFFDNYKNTFGETISYSRLYGFLDRQDFISEVRSLNMEAKGTGAKRSRDGDLALSPYGIAVLKEVKSFLM